MELRDVSPSLVTFGVMTAVLCIFLCLTQIVYIVIIFKDAPRIVNVMKFDGTINEDAVRKTIMMMINLVLGLYLGFTLINLFSSLLLLFGIHERKHVYFLPWLICYALAIVLNLLTCVCLLTLCAISAVQKHAQNILSVVSNFLLTAISCAAWILIASLYADIRTEDEKQSE